MKKDIAIFLFDVSGRMAEPWLRAGYECWIVDLQHPVAYETGGITREGKLVKVHADLTRPWLPPVDRNRIAFVGAFPPCDHVSVAGARWFSGKGLRKLEISLAMFATAAEFCDWAGSPYFLENPVSNMASHWRKSDHRFHPWHYTGFDLESNYTKTTCLWVGGGFVMPEKNIHPMVLEAVNYVIKEVGKMVPIKKALEKCKNKKLINDWYPDDRIHKCAPGPERHNIRSATPLGFSVATFKANSQ